VNAEVPDEEEEEVAVWGIMERTSGILGVWIWGGFDFFLDG